MLVHRRPETPHDSPDTFIQELMPVWDKVSAFEVYRLRKGERELIVTMEVQHIDEMSTPQKDVRELRVFLEDHARELGAATRYHVIATGYKKAPKAPRGQQQQPDQPNAELATWTPRFGENEPDTKAGDGMATLANFMKSIPQMFEGAIAAAESSLKLGQLQSASLMQSNAALAAENAELRRQVSAGQEWQFRIKELEVFVRMEERSAERDAEVAKHTSDKQMEMVGMLMTGLQALGTRILEDRKEQREHDARMNGDGAGAANGSTADDPRERASEPAAEVNIAADLRIAIRDLDQAKHDRIAELLGRVDPEEKPSDPSKVGRAGPLVWELLVGASQQESHEEACATLANIRPTQAMAARVNQALQLLVKEGVLTTEQANAIVKALKYVRMR